MEKLNLPTFDFREKFNNGKRYIFDPLRKKFVVLTPEEWVRQHFVSFLIIHKGYPAGLISNEKSLLLNNRTFRCDTLVYDKQGDPILIIEYKAPSVAITEAVFSQAANYNIALKVRYLIISNGLQHFCCRINYQSMRFDFLSEIPNYGSLDGVLGG